MVLTFNNVTKRPSYDTQSNIKTRIFFMKGDFLNYPIVGKRCKSTCDHVNVIEHVTRLLNGNTYMYN